MTDVSINDLSRIELHTLQRQSINKLQAMEIPASHGLLKSGDCVCVCVCVCVFVYGRRFSYVVVFPIAHAYIGSRNMLQRLSFNTLKQRKVNVPDRAGE